MKLLYSYENPGDAVEFYRGKGPLSAIDWVKVVESDRKDPWIDLANSDAHFMCRPIDAGMAGSLSSSNEIQYPVWVDYDDLFTMIPTLHPFRVGLTKRHVFDTVKEFVTNAPIVTVSTDLLKQYYVAQFGIQDADRIKVIPNAWDYRFMREELRPFAQRDIIIYRGSPTHTPDTNAFRNSLVQGLSYLKDKYEFVCAGVAPEEIPEGMKFQFYDWAGMMVYVTMMKRIGPKLMIVPLADHPFNHCKSNIAAIEGTWAGANIIAPHWPEWCKIPGVLTYKTQEEFVKLLRDFEYSQERVNAAWGYIKDELNLDVINRKYRVPILKELQKIGFGRKAL